VEEKLHPIMKEKRRGKIIFEAKDVQNKVIIFETTKKALLNFLAIVAS
jgi:hypothetical protein